MNLTDLMGRSVMLTASTCLTALLMFSANAVLTHSEPLSPTPEPDCSARPCPPIAA